MWNSGCSCSLGRLLDCFYNSAGLDSDAPDPGTTVIDRIPDKPRTVSGRKVVVAMFGFGIIVVGAMWLYWELYQRPFRDLQYAIAAEFENSSPQVIGGRLKSDEQNPQTLRIIIRVPFDPISQDQKSQQHAHRLVELAQEHHDLSTYDVLEVHLRQPMPESAWITWSQAKPVDEWFTDPWRAQPTAE